MRTLAREPGGGLEPSKAAQPPALQAPIFGIRGTASPRADNSKFSARRAPPLQIRIGASKQGVRVHTMPLSSVRSSESEAQSMGPRDTETSTMGSLAQPALLCGLVPVSRS